MKKHPNRLPATMEIESKPMKIFAYALLILIVILVAVPLYTVVMLSFKTKTEAMGPNVFSLPESFAYFENFKYIWTKGKLLTGFKNTGILIVTSVAGSVVMGTMVAYILGRFQFKGRRWLYLLFLFPTIVPAMTTQVATFTIVRNLGLYNTIFAGIILYVATDIMQIYIFLQHIEKIPMALDESARIDGASYMRIYGSIIMPQMKPAIATAVIIKALTIYNDLFIPYLYMPKSSLKTVTTSILAFVADRTSDWGLVGAGIVSVIIPTILIYLFMQRYIIGGVVEGAVKA